MTIDQLYSQVSILSVADQLRLVERVAVSAIEPRPTLDVIGMFSDNADLIDRVGEEAMAARARPLRTS